MKKVIYLVLILFIQCKNKERINKTDYNIVTKQTENIEVKTKKNINYNFEIVKVDSIIFKKNQLKFQIEKRKINKITDINLIIKKTKKWATIKCDLSSESIDQKLFYLEKISLENGEVIYCNQNGECSLVAYYPDENIILSECGHNSDDSYNLVTGKNTSQVGNPEYMLESTNKKFRLNGYFPGQECSNYFIQKNINGEYLKIFEINEVYPFKNVPENFCTMDNLFWTNDYTLNFTIRNYKNKDAGILEYYQLKIKEL